MSKRLYVFTAAGELPADELHHGFSDTVAICHARTLHEAVETFNTTYRNVTEDEVSLVQWNSRGVAVLTDY